MVRRIVVLLLVILSLFLAACQSSAGGKPETVPAPATRDLAPSAPADRTRAIESTVRDSGAGGVTVEATWLGMQDGTLAFRLAFNTHSVDLSAFDVAANVVLRDGDGRERGASGWQDERRDSHHRAGTVRFLASPADLEGGRVSLVVRNLAGVAERILAFEIQQ